MNKGTIENGDKLITCGNKQQLPFYIRFTETKYTDDGLDYIGDDMVEIYPDDIYKFNITEKNIGEEISFKIQTVMDPIIGEYVDVARLIN